MVRALNGLPLVAAVVAMAASGCGGEAEPRSSQAATAPFPDATPDIVAFDGPQVVECAANGEVKVLSFAYQTKNATAVEAEIDGVTPPGGAVHDPGGGTVNFEYVCPGPHTLKFSAFGTESRAASTSITFDKSNHVDSVTSSSVVEAQAR